MALPFFLNTFLLHLQLDAASFFYIVTMGLSYISLMIAGLWISRLLRTNLMQDVFNNKNESFQLETKLMENEYSVNLSTIAYNHLLKHYDKYEVKPKFYIINFDNPRKSHRCNPLNSDFMTDISDAYEAAYTIMLNLNRSWIQKQGDFFVESPIILLATIIWFFSVSSRKYSTQKSKK